MYRIQISCKGISESAAKASVADIFREFDERPWQHNVQCRWDGSRVVLQAENDYDSTGQALLDEFSDAVCACIPIEATSIIFAIESVGTVSDSDA
jgi:hypothetical protein